MAIPPVEKDTFQNTLPWIRQLTKSDPSWKIVILPDLCVTAKKQNVHI
jgi:hypothetical protein